MMSMSETELEIYEALYKNLGARIIFNCDHVTYRGIVDSIFPDCSFVKTRHTEIIDGNHYLGTLRFKFREISSFTVVESSESVNRYPKNEYLLNILKNNRPVPSSTIAKVLYGDKLSDLSDDDNTDDKKIEEKFVLDLPKHLERRLPKDYMKVCAINDDFYQAIHCINDQQVIGVSFHGQSISRFGKLTWICIATDVCSYIFNVQQLEKEMFDKGLRDIFESKTIKKVIHDSRFPSDCLAHKYSTILNNVFDTRVADFVISMQRYNDEYKFHTFSSLDCLLRTYLKVPQEFLFTRETCKSSSNQETFFSKKPISNGYLYDLLKSVLYLKLLKEKLSAELLVPFYRATGFFRTVLAKSCNKLIDDLGSILSRPDQVPTGLLMEGIQTVYFRRHPKRKYISLECKFIDPRTEKILELNSGLRATGKNDPLKKLDHLLNTKDIKKIHKENYLLPNDFSREAGNPSKNYTKEVNSESVFSSFRHLDEVYHKLVSRMYADQSEIVVNVKPIVNYSSKFTDKNATSSCCNTNKDINDSFQTSSPLNKASDESSNIWLKLREEHISEQANYSVNYSSERKIKYVPG